MEPGFQEAMVRHFETLPTRYALDVNLDSLDVLSHQRLLNEARSDQTSVSYAVRPVEILVQRSSSQQGGGDMAVSPQVRSVLHFVVCPRTRDPLDRVAQNRISRTSACEDRMCVCLLPPTQGQRGARRGMLPKPAFGSSPNLQV